MATKKQQVDIRSALNRSMARQHVGVAVLSSATGISVPSLSRFLSGRVTTEYDNIISIFMALGLSVGYQEVGVALCPPQEIRHRIRQIITGRNIRVRDLSLLCNVNYCTLSSWLNGNRQIPCIQFEAVLTALGLNILPLA